MKINLNKKVVPFSSLPVGSWFLMADDLFMKVDTIHGFIQGETTKSEDLNTVDSNGHPCWFAPGRTVHSVELRVEIVVAL